MKQNCYWLTNELFTHPPSDKQKKYMTTADRRENKIQTKGLRKGKKNLESNKDHLLYSARRHNDNKPLLTRLN